MKEYLTGIDWSGDPGDPSKLGSSRWLIVTACHALVNDLPAIDKLLAEIRIARMLPETYAFKYSGSRPLIRDAFLSTLGNAPITITALVINKSAWDKEQIKATPGTLRIARAVAGLLVVAPQEIIANQRIMIDLPSNEEKIIRLVREEIRNRLRGEGRDPIRALKPVPDHRLQGGLIQIADMAAGLIHDECEERQISKAIDFRSCIAVYRD